MGILLPQKPQKEKEESDLDKVLKGLNVAGNLFGIYSDFTKIEANKAQTEADRTHREKMLGLQEKQDDREQRKFEADQAGAPIEQNYKKAQTAKIYHDMKKPSIENEPKQNQFQAATYATRAAEADKIMSDLKTGGYDRAGQIGAALNYIAPKAWESDNYKSQSQAERNFLTAVLRKESGATITDDELSKGESQYFDRPGDSDQVKAQKARNRAVAIAGLKAEGEPAMGRVNQYAGQAPDYKQQSSGGASGGWGNEAVASPVDSIKVEDIDAELQRRSIKKNGIKGALPGKKK